MLDSTQIDHSDLIEHCIAYIFKHMRDLDLRDTALSMQLLQYIDDKKARSFLASLREYFTVTNVKLINGITPEALVTMTHFYYFARLGNNAFWRRMTQLLEENLKEDVTLQTDDLISLLKCLTSSRSRTSIISSELIWKFAINDLSSHIEQGLLDYEHLY